MRDRRRRGPAVDSSVKVFTAAGNYAILNETTLIVNKTVGGATIANLPASPVKGRELAVKDGKGDAAANNITLDPAGAGTIDGAATLVLSTNYKAVRLMFNGTEWNVMAAF